MLKRFIKRVQINLRQSRGDRAAILSYRDYHKKVKHVFGRMNVFTKLRK